MVSLFQTSNRFLVGLLSLVMNIKTAVPAASVAGQGELGFQRVGTVSLFKGTMSNKWVTYTKPELGKAVAHSELISLQGKTFETAGINKGKIFVYLFSGSVIVGVPIIASLGA